MEWGIKILPTFLVLLATTGKHIIEACQCDEPKHPQERFCRAEYVIIGRIVEKIEEYDDDFPQIPFVPHIPGDGIPVPSTTREPELLDELPLDRLPILRKVQAPKEPEVFPPMIVNDGPMHGFYPGMMAWRGKLKYVVQVEKVFKGKERILKNSKVVIETDLTSSLCGRTELEVEERYLISGSYDGDKMSLYLCDWVERTTELTKTQRRGLRHFYSKYCGKCEIQTGIFYFPGDPESKRVCSYNSHLYSDVDCEAKFSSCIQRSNGTCRWYKGKDYKTCKKLSEMKQGRTPQ